MKRIWAVALVCMMAVVGLAVPANVGLAEMLPDGEVSLFFVNTKIVTATLTIGDSGKAKCSGKIVAHDADASISLTVKLLRKEGSKWSTIKTWNNSGKGAKGVSAGGTYTISPGTYKVTTSGTVTSGGTSEAVFESSCQKTY